MALRMRNTNKAANTEHPYRGVFVFVRSYASPNMPNTSEHVRYVRIRGLAENSEIEQ